MTFVHFVCIALQWKPFDQVNIFVRQPHFVMESFWHYELQNEETQIFLTN